MLDGSLARDEAGERVGAARHHDGVARIEQAGGHRELCGEERLHEGQAEAPDVEAAAVEQVEHAVATLGAAGEPEHGKVGDKRAGKSERHEDEQVMSELRRAERVDDRARQGEGEHDLAHALLGARPKRSRSSRQMTCDDDGDECRHFQHDFFHAFESLSFQKQAGANQ